MKARAALVAMAAIFCMAAASDPAERLPDPSQEARARALFKDVRCLVCQNESIDDSEAELAHDLRQIVREQVKAGHSDTEIKTFLTERYGEFVLLKPSFSLGNLALWGAPFVIVVGGAAFLATRVRRRETEPELDSEETAKIARLLEDETP